MKVFSRLIFWSCFLFVINGVNAWAGSPGQAKKIEEKIDRELNKLMIKIAPEKKYLLAVQVESKNNRVKEIIEGETTENTVKDLQVPRLPGFELPEESPNSSGSRESFRFRDEEEISSVDIQVVADTSLGEEKLKQMQKVVESYLQKFYPTLGHWSFETAEFNPIEEKPTFPSPWVWVLGISVLAAVFTALIWSKRRHRSELKEKNIVGQVQRLEASTSLSPNVPMTEKNEYGIPLTEAFADRRSQLLNYFTAHSEIFRDYFEKLTPKSKSELCAGLRGPAYDGLSKFLGLKIPPYADEGINLTEEKLIFYFKDFHEFITIHHWQNQQFFGFLHQLSDEQLFVLFKQENPIVKALMLKFLRPEQSAKILDKLDSVDRSEVFLQSSRLGKIPPSELNKLENLVRERAKLLPKVGVEFTQDDAALWGRILLQSGHQDELLTDLEMVRPELYPQLAKYRFRLEDLATLPSGLVGDVLSRADNEELAKALAVVSHDVVVHVLAFLPDRRRQILEGQILSYKGLPEEGLKMAKMELTQKFREVLV